MNNLFFSEKAFIFVGESSEGKTSVINNLIN